jgi:FkbM family methyltransferase
MLNYRNFLKGLAFLLLDQRKQRGFHLLNDIRYLSKVTSKPIEVIFDVGANVGQSIMKYKSYFPSSEIHAFEPIDETFEYLISNIDKYKGIYPNKFALSSLPGSKYVALSKNSPTTNSLRNEVTQNQQELNTQLIEIKTLDDYFQQKKLKKINFLKTDTEGFDLEVLKGGKELLDQKCIDFIVTEVTFDPQDNTHTNFLDVNDFLWKQGYGLVGFYDWGYKNKTIATIKYCNALYMLNE